MGEGLHTPVFLDITSDVNNAEIIKIAMNLLISLAVTSCQLRSEKVYEEPRPLKGFSCA